MEQRILVVDDDPGIVDYLRTNLGSFGFTVDDVSDAADVEAAVASRRPDVILLDILIPERDGFAVLRRLTAGRGTSTIPLIVVSARSKMSDRVRALRLGADDYVVKPFDMRELVARVRTVLRRSRQFRDLSPLTGLPGNTAITREIERRITTDVDVAIVHVDVDHFKTFNDRYGFLRGDGVITFCAACLSEVAADHDELFIGHVGGDDFVVVMPADGVEVFCQDVIARWDAGIGSLYDSDDAAAGEIIATNRTGETQRFPLASISMGVATSRHRRFTSPWEASAIAAEMKEHAKRTQGSGYAVDRRTR